jgi:Raf kinase inhibitor-like YbhB/YbcL family protein
VTLLSVAAAAVALSSPAFAPDQAIPRQYTCDGANRSPVLRWTAPPRRTRSFALVLDDPDAPSGTFTHWLAWGIKPTARRLAAGARPPRQGRTSAGTIGYTGPCPPEGPAHRYVFKLYALRKPLPLRAGAGRSAVDRALKGRVLRVTRLVGHYARS